MNILTIGDVVGAPGCDFLRKHLPAFKRLKNIALCVANGENSANGNGVTPASAQSLFDSGVDVITTGNHVYSRSEIHAFLDEWSDIVRPANYPAGNPGKGFTVFDMGRIRVGIVNLMGNSFISENLENAFICAERTLAEPELADCRVILVDFHAEATGEKRAMGFFLDGKVSAVFGTHTHILTADDQALPGGTGYITDIGMTGPKQSVLGVKSEIVISRFRTSMPARFELSDSECMMNGCIFEIDEKTGGTVSTERVWIE
ncbi:MAG: TIGR00282 family metallophosphoesterase [Oscillospiraceae bacterium]|nr:TIGR00282 family metallophosphoesterase [Oscillospiraceae bacterium]